jgi:hypothetical protein
MSREGRKAVKRFFSLTLKVSDAAKLRSLHWIVRLPVRPVTSGVCLGSRPSFSSQVGNEQANTGFDGHNVV